MAIYFAIGGIISWPAVVKGKPRENWDTVVTMDFLATIMEVLDVLRWIPLEISR